MYNYKNERIQALADNLLSGKKLKKLYFINQASGIVSDYIINTKRSGRVKGFITKILVWLIVAILFIFTCLFRFIKKIIYKIKGRGIKK